MMSKSQNRTVDKHIIWSDMNLNPDDWRDQLRTDLQAECAENSDRLHADVG